MATSRYADLDTAFTARSGGPLDNRTTSSGTTTASGNSATNQNTTGTSRTQSTQTNMDGTSLAALQTLIRQLLAGGTPAMQQQQASRNNEQQVVSNLRGQYDKQSAFADAQGLISQQMRRALEAAMPGISRAAEDAGSSGGALRALLMQDAASRAAESSSALGVQTATNYGGIAANLSQVMEQLTRSDPTVVNALIQALNVSKGAVVKTDSTTNSSQNTTSNTVDNKVATENKNTNTDYAPFATTAPATSTSPIYFGPASESETVSSGIPIGSTLDTLLQLQGGSQAWNSYRF